MYMPRTAKETSLKQWSTENTYYEIQNTNHLYEICLLYYKVTREKDI